MIAAPFHPLRRATGPTGRPTPLRLFVALLVAVIAVLGLTPGAALAENTVVSSSPESGTSLTTAPDAIVIVFAEELGAENTIALECDANPITLTGTPEVIEETTLEIAIDTALPRGTCTARWTVTNADGEENGSGIITFIVENDAAVTTEVPAEGDDTTAATVAVPTVTTDSTTTPAITVDDEPTIIDLSVAGDGNAAVWLGRLISTLGIAVLFGALALISGAWPEGVEYLVTVKFFRVAWIVALIGTLLFVAFASAAVTPEGGGGPFNPGTWIDLLSAGWAGRIALFRLVLVIASAWVAFRPDRVIDPTTQVMAFGIPGLAAAAVGISRTTGDLAGLGVVMGILHALAMSLWVGGVVLLARVVLKGPGDEDLVHAVRGFSRYSTPAIIVTIVTGLIQMFRLDGNELFQSGHGRVVVLKAIVVAVMIFVAFSARQFVAQRLNRAQEMNVPLAARLRRAFGAEAGIGVLTLAMSAWLLAFTPPNVNAAPTVDYAVDQTHIDPAGLMDVEVKFTDDTVGLIGMQVEVKQPAEGLLGLTVVLRAPENPNIGGFRQTIPMTLPGFAVRDEATGFPMNVAGNWTVTVEANTTAGTIISQPVVLPMLGIDGEPAESVVTPPSVNTIEVEVDTTES